MPDAGRPRQTSLFGYALCKAQDKLVEPSLADIPFTDDEWVIFRASSRAVSNVLMMRLVATIEELRK